MYSLVKKLVIIIQDLKAQTVKLDVRRDFKKLNVSATFI